MNGGEYSPGCPNNNNERQILVIIHCLVATLLAVTCHLGFILECKRGGSGLSHLGSLSLVSIRGCWPLFGSFSSVLHHLWLSWWSLWLMTWRCHIAIGCSIVGCVLWL